MRRKSDIFVSRDKLLARKIINQTFNPQSPQRALPQPSPLLKKSFDNLFKNNNNQVFRLDNTLEKSDKDLVLQAYMDFKEKKPNSDDSEFKSALEEFLLEKYISKISLNITGREDITLINKIIEKLKNPSWINWWTQEFSMVERIHCAKQLSNYLLDYDNRAANTPNTTIPKEVLDKYSTLQSRFSSDFQAFNDSVRRPKAEKLIKPKFRGFMDARALNIELPNAETNTFLFCQDRRTPILYFVGVDKKKPIKIDITGIDLDQLQKAIDDENLSLLKNILKDKFPKDVNLDLAKEAIQTNTRMDYLRAKIGYFTSDGKNSKKHKSAGDKAREQVRRTEVTYYPTLNDRVDNLKGATSLCNQKAAEFGFSNSINDDIGLEVFKGNNLANHINVNPKKNRFIAQIDEKGENIIGLFYVFYIGDTPITTEVMPVASGFFGNQSQSEARDKLVCDLIYITSENRSRDFKPPLRVRDLSLKYSKNGDSSGKSPNISRKIDEKCPDLINFIISVTGFVPPNFLNDKFTEMAEILDLSRDLEEKVHKSALHQSKKTKYQQALNTIQKISTLPYAYFRTSESVIPRYRCKEILTKLSRKFTADTEPLASPSSVKEQNQRKIDQEYFRSSYKLYKHTKNLPTDNEIKNSLNKNPRFYYCPETRDIAYVDAFEVIHKSKLKQMISNDYLNAILDNTPEKLSNILDKKTPEGGNEYTLDSEEVFKYISLKVEDKDGFKMCTVSEELESIIADEAATTRDAFKSLGKAALYAGLATIIVLVPGLNLTFLMVLGIGLAFAPSFFDNLTLGAYKNAFVSLGTAAVMIGLALGLMAIVSFVPGLNFVGTALAAGSITWYIALASASLTTAFALSATISAASKNPKVKEANKELVNLKEQIKAFTLDDGDDDDDDDDIDNLLNMAETL